MGLKYDRAMNTMVKQTLPAGLVWVGDPSYVMKPELYTALVKAMADKDDGFVQLTGWPAGAVVQDAGEDTEVRGSDNFSYGMISGLFGLTPACLTVGQAAKGKGRWVRFGSPVLFQSSSKRILITSPGFRLDVAITDMESSGEDEAPSTSAPRARQARKPRMPPADSAAKHALGKCKIGADASIWRVEKTKTGVKRWVRCSSCTAN